MNVIYILTDINIASTDVIIKLICIIVFVFLFSVTSTTAFYGFLLQNFPTADIKIEKYAEFDASILHYLSNCGF